MRTLTCLALALALAAPALAGTPKTDGPAIGAPAPAFSLVDHAGKAHTLADYAGKVVVLEWTNPTCPFVVRHYRKDTMETLARAYDGKPVVWLAINSTHFADAAANAAWVKAEGLPFPVLDDHSGATGHAYGARTSPDMFVIDPAGKVIYRGAIDDDPFGDKASPLNYVKAAVDAHLAGRPIDPSRTKPYGCSVKYAP